MNFHLSVSDGEVLSLIGPSGAGKSTLLNLVAGFLQAHAGQINVDGEFIHTLAPAQRPVSMIFQQHNLFPHLDLFTNVGLGVDVSMRLNVAQRDAINEAFNRLGIEGLQKRKPGEVSGGQRQRAALARVLVRNRKVLLLDEAFAALGPAQRDEMIEMVADLVREKEMNALLISHQPQDAMLASKRTAFLEAGRISTIDSTDKLLRAPDQPEVRQYLGLK